MFDDPIERCAHGKHRCKDCCKTCAHPKLGHAISGDGCEVCSCALNRAGQEMSRRKAYVPNEWTVMFVDPSLELGPWNTPSKKGMLT